MKARPGLHVRGVQTKLAVGEVSDPAEREADAAAEAVMAGAAPALAPRAQHGAELLRKPSTTVPGLEEATVTTLTTLIASESAADRQKAIDTILAERSNQFDKKLLKDSTMRYMPKLQGAGKTDSPGFAKGKSRPSRVRLGPEAFVSVTQLYSTMLHEYQHVLQNQNDPTVSLVPGQPSEATARTEAERERLVQANADLTSAQETEAYLTELSKSDQTGLSKDPQALLNAWLRMAQEWNGCTDADKARLRGLYDAQHTRVKAIVDASSLSAKEKKKLQTTYDPPPKTAPKLRGDGATGLAANESGSAPSAGQPIDAAARGFFESRFGRDFSGVRVHADAGAARSADAIAARAYTIGTHIVFGPREYAPGTEGGRRLLAHELAHVVQQGGAPPRSTDAPTHD